MAKYIDIDSLRFPNICIFDMTLHGATVPMVRLVDLQKLIPAADVVEVVRCRECIFWDTSWNPGVGEKGEAYYCPRCHLVTLKDSFCSGACRKDGGPDE